MADAGGVPSQTKTKGLAGGYGTSYSWSVILSGGGTSWTSWVSISHVEEVSDGVRISNNDNSYPSEVERLEIEYQDGTTKIYDITNIPEGTSGESSIDEGTLERYRVEVTNNDNTSHEENGGLNPHIMSLPTHSHNI